MKEFHRHSDQCVVCACHYANTEGEVREMMDQAGIECSLEQNVLGVEPCRFFQEE